MSDWGKGVINDIGWGQGANNDIGWGSIYDKSNAGETLLSGSGFDSDYQAVLNFATSEGDTLPSSTIQGLQNDFMVSINPFFSKLKELHLWAGESGLGGFKSIDFARLSKADYYNSPTLLANGVKGNGTSSYLDLKFNYLTESQEDSISMGYYSIDGTDGSLNAVMGAFNSVAKNASYMLFNLSDNETAFVAANSEFERFEDLPLTIGGDDELISVSHNGTQLKFKRNEVSLGIANKTGNPPNLSAYALARNFDGVQSFFSGSTLALTFHADELTASELGILSTAIKTYLNAI
jgi:hypothetical protein